MTRPGSPRVGVIQSAYIPWRGYFDFIDSVDLFIVYDDVLYSRGTWRNRNRVLLPSGPAWITVPVEAHPALPPIDELRIASSSKPWRESHRGLLRQALAKAPWGAEALALWEAGVAGDETLLSRLNVRLIELTCVHLGIHTPLRLAREFAPQGARTERLIDLLTKVGARCYLSGPAAKGYLDERQFRDHGIRLEYKSYDYAPYPQPRGSFDGQVTVLDLIANTGPDARAHIKSRTPDEVAVP